MGATSVLPALGVTVFERVFAASFPGHKVSKPCSSDFLFNV
jgi:hypothetical protein